MTTHYPLAASESSFRELLSKFSLGFLELKKHLPFFSLTSQRQISKTLSALYFVKTGADVCVHTIQTRVAVVTMWVT